jgi:hypothetical protein
VTRASVIHDTATEEDPATLDRDPLPPDPEAQGVGGEAQLGGSLIEVERTSEVRSHVQLASRRYDSGDVQQPTMGHWAHSDRSSASEPPRRQEVLRCHIVGHPQRREPA